MADQTTDRALLLQPFHPDTYEYDPKGNVYVSGPVIEQRLDRATGGLWAIADLTLTDRQTSQTSGKALCDVVCALWLELPGIGRRPGYGQMTLYSGADYADAAKGATTAAIRSAANRFGVGREIWPQLAADHWLNWLTLLRTPEQVAGAKALLTATSAWLDSDSASRDHRDAWNLCYETVRQVVIATSRALGPVRDTDKPQQHEEAGDDPASDTAPKSDPKTMKALAAKYQQALDTTDPALVERMLKAVYRQYQKALEDGSIRRGGECAGALDKLHNKLVAHHRAMTEGAPSPEEVAKGLVDLFDAAADADELQVAYTAQLAAEQAQQLTEDGRAAVDEAAARAAERVGEMVQEEAA